MTEAPASSAPTDGARLSRRGVERLDLLLLPTIEALDLNGGEAGLDQPADGLQTQFPNRVELEAPLSCPLRRTTWRDQLDLVDAESLICLVCAMADRLYPMLHQPRAANRTTQPTALAVVPRAPARPDRRMNQR